MKIKLDFICNSSSSDYIVDGQIDIGRYTITKKDNDGIIWIKDNKDITQLHSEFGVAYREEDFEKVLKERLEITKIRRKI